MERKPRRFVRFLAIALALFLMPIFVFATAVAATGTVTVNLHEKNEGMRLFIPVPALLLDAAVFAAPRLMPHEALADVRSEIAPYLKGLEILADEIRNCPEGVLVEVETRDEYVRVEKTWRSIRIEVDNDDVDLTVSVPARLVSRALDLLG